MALSIIQIFQLFFIFQELQYSYTVTLNSYNFSRKINFASHVIKSKKVKEALKIDTM